MRSNFISLLLIILLVVLPVKSSIIKFEEKQAEPIKILHVLNTDCYDDNTIIVRIARENYTTPSRICVQEYLSIRTIYPNGTVKEFDISLDIQPFNFCFLPQFNPIKIYAIKTNLLFVTYTVADDVNNPFT